MKKAQYKWIKIAGDDRLKNELIERENYAMDSASALSTARNDGRKEGLIEGKKEGLIEGKKQIALNMKVQGLDDNFIAKCLNISIDELNKLMNKMN